MNEMKKELAKAVKAIRGSYPETRYPNQYPKLMMTAAQMAKKTATVNCGYHTGADNEKAERILADPAINELLNKYGATMEKEIGCEKTWQVRIYY